MLGILINLHLNIKYTIENFKDFLEFDLLFTLDEEEITLNIPLKEIKLLLNDKNNNKKHF